MIQLDETDKLVLRRLQEDARISFQKIAKEIGVSETTIFHRIKKLQSKKVIKGFKTIIDPDSVGKTTAAIVLVKADPKVYKKALEELRQVDDIYEIYDVTGAYYSILKVRTRSTEELAKIIDQMGTIEGVIGTETAVVLRTVKEEVTIKI